MHAMLVAVICSSVIGTIHIGTQIAEPYAYGFRYSSKPYGIRPCKIFGLFLHLQVLEQVYRLTPTIKLVLTFTDPSSAFA